MRRRKGPQGALCSFEGCDVLLTGEQPARAFICKSRFSRCLCPAAAGGGATETTAAPLAGLKLYNQRCGICPGHQKARRVVVQGVPQRFCHQCGRLGPAGALQLQGAAAWLLQSCAPSKPQPSKPQRPTSDALRPGAPRPAPGAGLQGSQRNCRAALERKRQRDQQRREAMQGEPEDSGDEEEEEVGPYQLAGRLHWRLHWRPARQPPDALPSYVLRAAGCAARGRLLLGRAC